MTAQTGGLDRMEESQAWPWVTDPELHITICDCLSGLWHPLLWLCPQRSA